VVALDPNNIPREEWNKYKKIGYGVNHNGKPHLKTGTDLKEVNILDFFAVEIWLKEDKKPVFKLLYGKNKSEVVSKIKQDLKPKQIGKDFIIYKISKQ